MFTIFILHFTLFLTIRITIYSHITYYQIFAFYNRFTTSNTLTLTLFVLAMRTNLPVQFDQKPLIVL